MAKEALLGTQCFIWAKMRAHGRGQKSGHGGSRPVPGLDQLHPGHHQARGMARILQRAPGQRVATLLRACDTAPDHGGDAGARRVGLLRSDVEHRASALCEAVVGAASYIQAWSRSTFRERACSVPSLVWILVKLHTKGETRQTGWLCRHTAPSLEGATVIHLVICNFVMVPGNAVNLLRPSRFNSCTRVELAAIHWGCIDSL